MLHPQDHPLLSGILWSEGFRSALVTDTYHMHKPAYGFGRGFDDVIWIRGQEGGLAEAEHSPAAKLGSSDAHGRCDVLARESGVVVERRSAAVSGTAH